LNLSRAIPVNRRLLVERVVLVRYIGQASTVVPSDVRVVGQPQQAIVLQQVLAWQLPFRQCGVPVHLQQPQSSG
jgi:hypothetical protein